jgi:hypothetical protein
VYRECDSWFIKSESWSDDGLIYFCFSYIFVFRFFFFLAFQLNFLLECRRYRIEEGNEEGLFQQQQLFLRGQRIAAL